MTQGEAFGFLAEDPVEHRDPSRGLYPGYPLYIPGKTSYGYALANPVKRKDPSGMLPTGTPDQTTCLICTVYAEGRGTSQACQWAVASVIINRVNDRQSRGRNASVCSVVSEPGQFNGYGNANYRECEKCTQIPKSGDLHDTYTNFSTPFPIDPPALFFGNNTPGIIDYFNGLDLTPVPFPSCPTFVFFTH